MKNIIAVFTACAVSGFIVPAHLFANPSTKDPEALLKIRPADKIPGDHLAPDYAAIQARYTKAKTASDELWKKYEDKTLAIGDARQIGPLTLAQAAVLRDAEFLKSRGEACGLDLRMRVDEMDARLRKMVGEMVNLPGVNKTALMNEVTKANAAGVKRLPQIEGLAKRKQFCQAEGEMAEIYDNMMRNAIWFLDTDLSGLFRPFATPLNEATELRKAKATEELQAIAAQGPDFTKLQTELTAAATAIGESGQATWNGAPLSGPDLLLAWNEQWPKLQAAAQRAAMADWTSEQVSGGGSTKYQARVDAQKQFAQALPAALAAIVQADVQRVAGPDAPALYKQYLAAIGTLCAMGPRQELEAACAPSLTALATKAGLDQEIAAYRAATEPVLAWKRFFARAKVKALSGNAPRIHEWCTTVLRSPHQKEHTLEPNPMSDIRQVQISSTPNLVLPGVMPPGPTPVVVVGDVVPVNAAGGRWVSRYQQRVFALVAAPPAEAWQTATNQLEQSLLAAPANAPLTIEAATLLAAARIGVFESAGGPVEVLTVEPLLTRFATLPDDGGSLLPRGTLPSELQADGTLDQQPMQSLTVRCDLLKPMWLQHECFVLLP